MSSASFLPPELCETMEVDEEDDEFNATATSCNSDYDGWGEGGGFLDEDDDVNDCGKYYQCIFLLMNHL